MPGKPVGQPGSVYFIQAVNSGLVKIGYVTSGSIESRLKSLQTGSPEKLVLRAAIATRFPVEAELGLHKIFRFARSHGEWFRPVDRLIALLLCPDALPDLINFLAMRVNNGDEDTLLNYWGDRAWDNWLDSKRFVEDAICPIESAS